MATPRVSAAGGLAALGYVLRKAQHIGVYRLWRRLRSRNACKTCALGMGGRKGGMVNEAGHFPEVCKKSIQAVTADMQGAIPERFFRETSLDRMAGMSARQLEAMGRLAFPLLALPGDTHFQRISWEEAMARTSDALKKADPQEVFVYSSGRSSNEAAFLLQLFARVYGTSHIHNCSYYCHQASGVALHDVYGSGTSSVVLEDLALADLAIVSGANPASNHPRLITQLVEMRERGGTVIMVNPLRELGLVRFRVPSKPLSLLFGSKVSDIYLQPHIGGDIALYKALLKGVIEAGGLDSTFVAAHTTGWEAVQAELNATDWGLLEAASGVPRAEINAAVQAILKAKRGIFMWAMGLTHHAFGVDNILALSNLALARGWLGRPGCGLLPIRGHSNVQGIGSMGVSPQMRAVFAERIQALYGVSPSGEGQDTMASMEAAAEGRVKAALLLGGNLFSSNPDRAWAAQALRNIPFQMTVTTKLNEGHIHGRGQTSILLPTLTRDEEAQATTQESMFNYVRVSEGGVPALEGEMHSEVEILAGLAEQVLPPSSFEWGKLRSHQALREAIAQVVPGYEALPGTEQGKEFQVKGRTFHEPLFGTPDGKARFVPTPLPEKLCGEGEFLLMTLRSEGQFNSVVYEDEDLYRGVTRRDVVFMSAEDAQRLHLSEGAWVKVENATGTLVVILAIADLRPGNLAMYYPEANALVPRRMDPRSRTPAFKSVVVRIEPLG